MTTPSSFGVTSPDTVEPHAPATVDAVVIGRNEGTRLVDCLASLAGQVRHVVYVDSGSTDGSIAAAQAAGATLVQLDPSRPFTAARARNAGVVALPVAGAAPPRYVQFIDGDCALHPGWVGLARDFLENHPRAAVACGRRRERYPETSIYNRLCDWEWNTPPGKAEACGGDALIRLRALQSVDGYRDALIAGEEPELCRRLRAEGWEIWRLDAEMTLHDAAITRFAQWWRRGVRAGHAMSEVGALHPDTFVPERRRIWFWGAALPVLALLSLALFPWGLFVIAGLYGLSFARVALRFSQGGLSGRDALLCGGLITLSKFCNLQGATIHFWRRLRGRAVQIIEYK